MSSSNDKEYIWTIGDLRELDKKLSVITEIQKDIKEIKEELAIKNHIVIDNTAKTDWKAIATVVTAIVAALGTMYLSIRGQ